MTCCVNSLHAYIMILHKLATLALQGSAGGVSGGYKPGKAAGKRDIFIYERAQNLGLRSTSGFIRNPGFCVVISSESTVPLVFHGRKVSMLLRIAFPFSEVLSLGYGFLFLLWTSRMPVWVTVWCLSFHTSRLQVKSPYCSPACTVDCNAGQLMNVVPFKLAAKTGGDTTF